MTGLLKLLSAPTKEQTAARAIRILSERGIERSKIRYHSDEFQIHVDGHRLWLGNLHAQSRLVWPWQRASVARRFLAPLLEQPERPRGIDAARPHLLPGVRDAFLFEALRLQAAADGAIYQAPSGFALGSRLWLAAFLDYPDSTSAVTLSDLKSWDSPSVRCIELGLENLRARSHQGLVEIQPGTYHSPWQDCYDPARLLLREVLAPLELQGDPVAFAPNWNHLFVTGSEDLEGLVGCLGLSIKILAQEPRPMSALPLVRRGGEWVDLELPRGHHVEPLLRKARVLELNQVYADQAGLIEKLHERNNTDLYVAKYNAVRDEKSGEHDSWAVWSRGVATLLPCTERVVFFDNERPEPQRIVANVPWRIAALHCGSLLQEAGFTPRRYLVSEFPSPQQLDAMRAACDSARSAAAPA
jgi:hypothetical protein